MKNKLLKASLLIPFLLGAANQASAEHQCAVVEDGPPIRVCVTTGTNPPPAAVPFQIQIAGCGPVFLMVPRDGAACRDIPLSCLPPGAIGAYATNMISSEARQCEILLD